MTPIATLIGAIIILAITLLILHAVIRSAVRAALTDHYKTVRYYEATGEWLTEASDRKVAPRTVEGVQR